MTAHILISPADMKPASTQASTSLVSLAAIPSIQISVLRLIHTKREMKTQNKSENVKLFTLRMKGVFVGLLYRVHLLSECHGENWNAN